MPETTKQEPSGALSRVCGVSVPASWHQALTPPDLSGVDAPGKIEPDMSQPSPQVPASPADLPDLSSWDRAGEPLGHFNHAGDHRTDNSMRNGGDASKSSPRCATAQIFAFVLLAACILVFFGLLRGLAKVPDAEVIKLAISATAISAVGIYGRNVLIVLGRSWINGLARNSGK